MPLTSDDQLRSWLREQGTVVPHEVGSMPEVALLDEILVADDWPYRRQGGGRGWCVFFE